MTQGPGKPQDKYQQIADRLRARIAAGEFPVDAQLPSIKALQAAYGASKGTADHALAVLRELGLVETRHGKGSFVLRAEPPPADEADLGAIARDLDAIGQRLAKVEAGQPGPELADSLGRIEGNLMDLYAKLGFDYPHEAPPETAGSGKAATS